jgi:hypothetical protein
MCNLKLNDNQVKRQVDDFGEVLDDLSSDGSSNFDLHGVINSATRRKNSRKDESDDEEIFNDAELESHCSKDDLEIQNDVNPDNSRSLELNIVDNIGGGVGVDVSSRTNVQNISVDTSSSLNVHNIGVGTSSSNNNPLDDNDFDECLKNNEEDNTLADCLF